MLLPVAVPRDKGKQFGFQGLEQGYQVTKFNLLDPMGSSPQLEHCGDAFSFHGKATWKNCLETIPLTLGK